MNYFQERTGVDCVPGAENLTFGHGDTAECHAEPPTCGCLYPGTNMLKRFCYSCQVLIEDLDQAWVDTDEDVVVCNSCKEKAEKDYEQTSFARPSDFLAEDLNKLD